jgi:hypothetical protein
MFVVYHIPSTVQVGPTKGGHPHSLYAKTYKTRGSALLAMRKFNARKHGPCFVGPGVYGVATVEHYDTNVVKMVTRTNLLSGKEYQEASNTIACCSPSSESYWSM